MDWRSIKDLYYELLGAFLTWLYRPGTMDTTKEGK